jgi:hypothetical protein
VRNAASFYYNSAQIQFETSFCLKAEIVVLVNLGVNITCQVEIQTVHVSLTSAFSQDGHQVSGSLKRHHSYSPR